MTTRRFLLVLLSPFLVIIGFVSLLVGLMIFSGTDLAPILAAIWDTSTPEGQQLSVLAVRLLLLPLQITFIAIVLASALWIIRRRATFSNWVLGEPLAGRLAGREPGTLDPGTILHPGRRRTLQQIFSSVVVIAALGVATVLSLGQFVPRDDLAVVVAALTSSLAWGARLPVGDILGGISNIFESNLAVGDRILYRHFDREVEGTVEAVALRFLSVRSRSGELTTIPFGDLRIFRNFSRGQHAGVYVTFPVYSADLHRAVALLTDMAPESPSLVLHLVEPWYPMSLEGQLGAITDICLFGKAMAGHEEELQLEMHELVQARFWEMGIPIAGKEKSAE